MSHPNSSPVDVAVIGGGVIGLAVGWRAASRGLRVCVLERDRAGAGTSWHAAGMLAPIAEATPSEEAVLELGLRAASGYEPFTRELAEAAGLGSVGYLGCETLMVARDPDEAEALERSLVLRRSYGLSVERLRPSQARRLEPALAPALRLALLVGDDHAIDPRALTAALVAALRRAGGELRERTSVDAIEVDGGRATGVRLAGGERMAARHVVVAAGVWSGSLAGIPDADRVPVAPVKGQILRLHDPTGPGLLTRVLRMGSTYLVPRGDGRYVLGATQEERGFDTTVTAGAAFELLRDAFELLPGSSEWVVDEFTAGLRPGTPDNLPAIGPSAETDGLHWAVGHRRGGILLAPVTAELVLAGLLGGGPDPVPELLAPGRFRTSRPAAPSAQSAPSAQAALSRRTAPSSRSATAPSDRLAPSGARA